MPVNPSYLRMRRNSLRGGINLGLGYKFPCSTNVYTGRIADNPSKRRMRRFEWKRANTEFPPRISRDAPMEFGQHTVSSAERIGGKLDST